MAAATLPTPPIGDPGSTTSVTANPYVVIAGMGYAAWKYLCQSLDARQTAITITSALPNANNITSATAHGFAVDDRVAVTGTTIPTGLAADTRYFVKTVVSSTVFTLTGASGGIIIAMSVNNFAAGTVYRSNFAGMPATWAALVSANAGYADRWLREVSWAYHNPGATAKELYRVEAENAVQLGWRYGALNTTTLLSPYVDYSQFEGQTISTPNIRGFESLPAIEQARFECIVATAGANQSRLSESARRFGVTNGASALDPNYCALALVANNAFDTTNFVLAV